MKPDAGNMKILMVSLGCDKNLTDSESMLGLLAEKGFYFTDNEEEADIIIINTCCFIGDAMQESVDTILELSGRRDDIKALIVTGCLAERYRDEILKEVPEVDAVLGTSSWDDIYDVICRVLDGEKVTDMRDVNRRTPISGSRLVTTGGHYAYLKIAEGCDRHCTYCIIPSLRGAYRSFPMEDLVAEAERMAEGGVKELILVAQETTLYGLDLYGKKLLPELLKRLAEIDGIAWIRLLYCYPEEITDELIDVMAEEKKICRYIDMPIQHASDHILGRMGRKTSRADIEALTAKLRARVPDIAIRTTLINGFPGETEKDHEELLDFVRKQRFERLGTFTYSAQDDTPAAGFLDQIPEEEKERRRDEVMRLQQEIAFAHAKELVGKETRVIMEGELPEDGIYVGRTEWDAPDVDGYIFIRSDARFMSGDIVRARITKARDYDLVGEVIDESAE